MAEGATPSMLFIACSVVSLFRRLIDERLISAARSDNEELLLEVLQEHDGEFDINFRDGCVHPRGALMSRSRPTPFIA